MNRILLGALLGLMLVLPAQAAEWQGPADVLAAARGGDAEAQLEMGVLYEYGFYLENNKVPALAWYMLAAEQGNEKAARRRDKLMQTLSQAQIEEARRLSRTLVGAATTAPTPAAQN